MPNSTKGSSQSGQVLVIILLVSVVGLTIGLSIAGRSLQTVEQTAQTEEANRAFSAAEAGVEEALLDLSAGTPIPTVPSSALEGGGEIADVEVTEDRGLETDLKKDEVVELKLGSGSGTVRIHWSGVTTLVLSKIRNEGGGNYSLQKYAKDCQTDYSNGIGIADASPDADFDCKIDITFDASDEIIRTRAMYAESSIKAEAVSGSLPVQGTKIESTGSSGESQRTVRAVRSLPALPEIFDYVLFSGGSISK